MDKKKLVTQIISTLEIKADNLTKAALTAHADATGDESKSENKYDTRGLEASYLAEAQAKMVAEIKEDISIYKKLELQDFTPNCPIKLSALVELKSEGDKRSFYFLGPNNGGLQIENDGHIVMLISSSSPFGSKLIGLNIGDSVQFRANNTQKEYEVIGVS